MRPTSSVPFLSVIRGFRGRATAFVLLAAMLAPAVGAAGPSRRSVDADLKFAREMAQQGLWREALFRWERVLAALPADSPDAGRVLNNIAVAAEALGDPAKARAAYEKAAALTPDREVATNLELFRRAHEAKPDAEGSVENGQDAAAGPAAGAPAAPPERPGGGDTR